MLSSKENENTNSNHSDDDATKNIFGLIFGAIFFCLAFECISLWSEYNFYCDFDRKSAMIFYTVATPISLGLWIIILLFPIPKRKS